MVVYAYACRGDGGFDVRRPMGSAEPSLPCPACGEAAPRVFGAPALARTPLGVAAALARGEHSADAPDVVSAPPAPVRPRRRAPADPRLSRLPRP